MRFITVRELRSSTAKVWRDLRKDRQVVVTSRGKPMAVVIPTDERGLGETLMAIQQQQAIQAVSAIRRHARRKGLHKATSVQIDGIIDEGRREKRR
jgi:prevent-host-death family protein